MSWKINYTKCAKEDLNSIYEYIAYELLVPDTANSQIDRIIKTIRTLDNMPERYNIYEEEPWKSQNLRYFPVDNYLVFYLPKKETSIINIIRIIYGGRDIRRQLEKTTEI